MAGSPVGVGVRAGAVWVDNDPQRRLDREPAMALARQRLEAAHRAYAAAAERRNELADSPTIERDNARRALRMAQAGRATARPGAEFN